MPTPGLPSTLEFDGRVFILCEGPDDSAFLTKLLTHFNLINLFQIRSAASANDLRAGGRPGFAHCFRDILGYSGFRLVKLMLVVTDYDLSKMKTIKEVRDMLKAEDYPRPIKAGAVKLPAKRQARPAVGIVLVPSDSKRGELATACYEILKARWPRAEDCVDSFLDCSGALTAQPPWTKSNLDKARVHAALAGFNRQDPEINLADMLRNGKINIADPIFTPVLDTITSMMGAFAGSCVAAALRSMV